MPDTSIPDSLRARLPLDEIPSNALAALAAIGAGRSLADGEYLFHEGDPAGFLFVVEAGSLVVTKRSEDGPEVTLRELGPGEIGGLTSMYVEKTRSATLQARGPTRVITFPRAALLSALAEHPELARALLAHLGQKVRAKTAQVAGLVGLGKIGRCLARILRGFGMTVLAHDVKPDPEFAESTGVSFVSLDELLLASDVVSLHVPLSPATHHMIDAARIGRMKLGAVLVNTSRGGLVDTTALIDALKSGQIGAAGLDVYEEESDYFFRDRSDRAIDDDVLARLLTFPNVLVTSHQAFLTSDALDNIAETTIGNIRAFLSGARGAALPNRVAARL